MSKFDDGIKNEVMARRTIMISAIFPTIASRWRVMFTRLPNSRRRSGPIRSRITVAPPKKLTIFPRRPHQRIDMNHIVACVSSSPPLNHVRHASR